MKVFQRYFGRKFETGRKFKLMAASDKYCLFLSSNAKSKQDKKNENASKRKRLFIGTLMKVIGVVFIAKK